MIYALLILDRLTKILAIKGILPLAKNPNLFFTQLNQTVIISFSALILLFLIFYLIKSSPIIIVKRGLLLIIVGGLSNLYDRVFYGFVIDWLSTPISVLNLADLSITLGCVILIRQNLWPFYPNQKSLSSLNLKN